MRSRRDEQSYGAPIADKPMQHPHGDRMNNNVIESVGPDRTNIPPQTQTPQLYQYEQCEEEEKDDYHYDDDEIQRDAADEMVAFAIHVALALFMLLFFGALAACILIVSNYGFLTLVLIACLLCAALTIGYFVSGLMDEDRVLKPVRRKIRRMHALATAVVVQELRDFHLDLNEHLMLKNGDEYDDYGMMDENGEFADEEMHQNKEAANNGARTKKKRRGPRSKVFAFIVKPFLKKKNGQKFKFTRKKKDTSATENVVSDSGIV